MTPAHQAGRHIDRVVPWSPIFLKAILNVPAPDLAQPIHHDLLNEKKTKAESILSSLSESSADLCTLTWNRLGVICAIILLISIVSPLLADTIPRKDIDIHVCDDLLTLSMRVDSILACWMRICRPWNVLTARYNKEVCSRVIFVFPRYGHQQLWQTQHTASTSGIINTISACYKNKTKSS